MKKDKYLLEKDHDVPMQSNNDLSTDFLMVFIIYLWDIRRIGTQSSLAAALLSQDLSIQEKYLNTPLFVQNQVTNQCINDFWYLLVSFGRNKGCSIHLTSRLCRAHILTQGCLTFIYLYKQPPSLDLLILFLEHGNWETFASMKLYKKAAIRLALSAGNYQFVTQGVSDLGEEELFEHRERMLTNGWVFISEPVVAFALFTTISEWIDCLYCHMTKSERPTQEEIIDQIIVSYVSSRKAQLWIMEQAPNWQAYKEFIYSLPQDVRET
jgi:hypothetical protein